MIKHFHSLPLSTLPDFKQLFQEQDLHIISLYSTLNYLIKVFYSVSHPNGDCEGLNQKSVLFHEQSLEEQSTLLFIYFFSYGKS